MKFTPGQVQDMLGLSPATFRHWKKGLPPLRGRNGYTPCFSPGDLLAIALIKTLAEEVGVNVSRLSGLAIDLFRHLSQPWAALERSILVIEPTRHRVSTTPEAQTIGVFDTLTIAIPLRPIIASLRERLLLEKPEDQQETLKFPPSAVGGARSGGAR